MSQNSRHAAIKITWVATSPLGQDDAHSLGSLLRAEANGDKDWCSRAVALSRHCGVADDFTEAILAFGLAYSATVNAKNDVMAECRSRICAQGPNKKKDPAAG